MAMQEMSQDKLDTVVASSTAEAIAFFGRWMLTLDRQGIFVPKAGGQS